MEWLTYKNGLHFVTANNSGVNKRQITDLVDQSIQINAHCFVVTADNRYILICGFWDKSFRVYSTETGDLSTTNCVSLGHKVGCCLNTTTFNTSYIYIYTYTHIYTFNTYI